MSTAISPKSKLLDPDLINTLNSVIEDPAEQLWDDGKPPVTELALDVVKAFTETGCEYSTRSKLVDYLKLLHGIRDASAHEVIDYILSTHQLIVFINWPYSEEYCTLPTRFVLEL